MNLIVGLHVRAGPVYLFFFLSHLNRAHVRVLSRGNREMVLLTNDAEK